MKKENKRLTQDNKSNNGSADIEIRTFSDLKNFLKQNKLVVF